VVPLKDCEGRETMILMKLTPHDGKEKKIDMYIIKIKLY